MTANSQFDFPPYYRIRKSRDFANIRKSGHKVQTRHFIIYYLVRPTGPSRLGLTVSRKVGNAVQRNSVKRTLREVFRLNRQKLPDHTDLSIIAKVGSAKLAYSSIYEELIIFFQTYTSDWNFQ